MMSISVIAFTSAIILSQRNSWKLVNIKLALVNSPHW